DLEAFARSVTERFSNPFIKHYLLSISLNSVSKYKARILGTVVDYQREQGRLPARLTFALAALFAFYRGRDLRDGALLGRRDGKDYRIQDDPAVLECFRDAWKAAGDKPVATIQFDMQFVSAGELGEFIEIAPEVVRRTASLVFMRGTLVSGERVVATCSGIWKILG
ncbi:MAG TPA: hypothetical protein VFE80_02925, partial [Beijerinckiaceae bacterium]|nr:hypothetical protein [Beijerinckiaceae bacterium]